MKSKIITRIFTTLVLLTLLSPFFVSTDLLFPFITSKAYFLNIFIELSLPFYLFLVFSRPEYRPNLKNPLNILVLLFLLVNWITAFTGVNVNRSIWGNFERMGGVYYITHLVLYYFYVLLLGQIHPKRIKLFMVVLISLAVFLSLNGIIGKLNYDESLTSQENKTTVAINPLKWPLFERIFDPSMPVRSSATFGNPIFFASFLIFPMFLSAFLAAQDYRRWAKITYGILAFLLLVGVVQSGTRGAVVGLIIGFFVALCFYIWFAGSKKARRLGFVAIGSFVVVIALAFTFHDKLPPGTTIRRVFSLNDSNTQARLIQWKIALNSFKDRPILGTGPENYYIAGNKYYDNELYNYDRSWFDKPHNYILEILVTNGSLGFVIYTGILVYGFFVIYKAYKEELLGLLEACLLLAGLICYQIQNLFVFDTIGASLMFYSFLGFLGYLAYELKPNQKKSLPKGAELPFVFPVLVSSIAGLVVVYSVYATNIVPMRVAKSVNYGYAYAAADPYKAAEFFNTAITLPFNFDKAETGSKFSDFATGLVNSPLATKEPKFVNEQLDKVLAFQETVGQGLDTDPIPIQKLANIYLYKAFYNQKPVDSRAILILNHAIELAPKRGEIRATLAQYRAFQGQWDEAIKLMKEAIELDPKHVPYQLQLVLVYDQAKRPSEALASMDKILESGYAFTSENEAAWALNAYTVTGQKEKALSIYNQLVKANLLSINGYVSLAKFYAQIGDKPKAIQIAQGIISADPTKKVEMEELIKTLQ